MKKERVEKYEAAVAYLSHHTEQDNFFTLLIQYCEEHGLNVRHLKVIMGYESFVIRNVFQNSNKEIVINPRALNPDRRTKKTDAMRVTFNLNNQRFWYYSKSIEKEVTYFERLIRSFLPKAEDIQIKKMEIQKSVLEVLTLENQLVLIQAGLENWHKIKL